MKRSRLALILLAPLAAIVVGLTAWKALGPKGPPLAVEPGAFALGELAEGATGKARVTIRNTGNQPLTFERVEKSCDCTDLNLPPSLAPGQSAPLDLTLDTTGKRGPLQKSVTLHVRGWPKTPVKIAIDGSVHEELRVEPKRQSFDGLTCRETRPVSLTVTRVDGKPLALTRLELPAALKATAQNASPSVVKLSGTLTAPDAPGEYQETLTLHTDDDALPTVTARLDFTVKAIYALKPAFAHFGLSREKAPKSIRVSISGPKTNLKLLSVPDSVIARLDGNSLIVARRESAPSRLTTEVRLATDNPKQPQIVVPVYSFFNQNRPAGTTRR